MLKLKTLILPSTVIQAPMAGCTDLAFRMIARARGMTFAFLEMALAEAIVRGNKKTLDLLKSAPWDRPLGAQLVGSNPESMAEAAGILEEMGFELIDINCGCPARKITVSGSGAALLGNPLLAREIFQKVVKKVKRIPVTVKIRKGFSDPSGQEAILLARYAEDSGVAAVAVHGRTRSDSYSKDSDRTIIREVKKALKIPVIGNGDIFTGRDAQELTAETGCDAVMIGRGGLGNPWIYCEAAAAISNSEAPARPSFSEIRDTALQHLDQSVTLHGERVGTLKFRQIGCWYFRGLPGIARLRHAINNSDTSGRMKTCLLEFEPEAAISSTVKRSVTSTR